MMHKIKELAYIICLCQVLFAGCYACSRHVSTVRPETIRPDTSIAQTYRLTNLTITRPSLSSDEDEEDAAKYHKEDTTNIYNCVKDALLKNYPTIFSESTQATPLSVSISWDTRYQGSPLVQSILTYMILPDTAEQETVYYVQATASESGISWSESCSASRYSETWETWLLPVGFIPIPGKSDWDRTFCFLRLGKDSIVHSPHSTINTKSCIRDMVFDPKVDGDVLAATIMRAVNKHSRSMAFAAMTSKGGVK